MTAVGHVLKRELLGAANVADASNHTNFPTNACEFVFSLSYILVDMASVPDMYQIGEMDMKIGRARRNRLPAELPAPQDGVERGKKGRRPAARSVTVNLAEPPLGWLRSRGHVSERQFAAGEQLRSDWERSGLPPRVTMSWDAPPPDRSPRGPAEPVATTHVQLAARRRFDSAVKALGPGLRDIAWRVLCAGEGMREAESALGWPARAGKLVLTMALDRLADHYRLR
jgi:Domain of unknown function (DUF6456)